MILVTGSNQKTGHSQQIAEAHATLQFPERVPAPEHYDARCAFCNNPQVVEVLLRGEPACQRCAGIYWRGAHAGAAHERGLMVAALPESVRKQYLSHVRVHTIRATARVKGVDDERRDNDGAAGSGAEAAGDG